MYVVCCVHTLPIISKPLEKNPDHLVWEALLAIDTHRSDDKTRKIPKSIFITPNLNESKGNCPPDHKLGPDGKCYKTLKIDPLVILKTQIESLFKRNRTATTEYDEDYDYSEYGESTESMSSISNGQYTVPLSLGFASENRMQPYKAQQQQQQQQTTFAYLNNLNRVVKDGAHGINNNADNLNKPFLVSTIGIDMDSEEPIIIASQEKQNENTANASTVSSTTQNITNASSSTVTTNTEPILIDNVENVYASSSSTTDNSAEKASQEYLALSSTTEQSSSQKDSTEIDDKNPLHELPSKESETLFLPLILTTTPSTVTTENATNNQNTIVSTVVTTEQPTTTITKSSPLSRLIFTMTTTKDELHNYDKTINLSGSNATTTTAIENVSSSTESNFDESQLGSSKEQIMMEDEIPTEINEPKFPALSQIVADIDKILLDLSEENPKYIDRIDVVSTTNKQYDYSDEQNTEKSSIEKVQEQYHDAVSTEQSKLIEINSTSPPSSSSSLITTSEQASNETDSKYEMINAYFVPSQESSKQLKDDYIVEENSNNKTAEQKYRLENASVIFDDEWSRIDSSTPDSSEQQSNIELIERLNPEYQFDNDDETKNLTARLAEDLLIRGPNMELTNYYDTATNTSDNESKLNSTSEVSDEVANISWIGSDITTEESIDIPREIAITTESTVDDVTKSSSINNANVLEKGSVTFDPIPIATHEPSSSVYSTFMSRLKTIPPFAEFNKPEQNIQYSNEPQFPINDNDDNSKRISSETLTSSDVVLPDNERFFDSAVIVEQPPINGKSLQLGINCYLRPLANKQYFIFCK